MNQSLSKRLLRLVCKSMLLASTRWLPQRSCGHNIRRTGFIVWWSLINWRPHSDRRNLRSEPLWSILGVLRQVVVEDIVLIQDHGILLYSNRIFCVSERRTDDASVDARLPRVALTEGRRLLLSALGLSVDVGRVTRRGRTTQHQVLSQPILNRLGFVDTNWLIRSWFCEQSLILPWAILIQNRSLCDGGLTRVGHVASRVLLLIDVIKSTCFGWANEFGCKCGRAAFEEANLEVYVFELLFDLLSLLKLSLGRQL